jgi:hypothetical protein
MRVRMKQLAAGPLGIWLAGEEVDVPESAGEALVQGGYADRVAVALEVPSGNTSPPLELETEMLEPPENTMAPKRGRPRRA